MQVELVYLVERQTVYHLFQIVNCKHVPYHIDMESAPVVFGSILYIYHRKIFRVSRSEEISLFECLPQRLDSPKKSGFRRIIDAGPLFGYGQTIGFFGQIRFLFHPDKGMIVRGVTRGKRQFLFQRGFQQLCYSF